LAVRWLHRPTHTRLELAPAGDYLDYAEAEELSLPSSLSGKGLVLSGKLPLWLWTALVRAYRDAPWVAVFQPPLGDQAVVVASRDESVPVGGLVISEV
jgi:CRISPR-associated protein Csx3